VDATQIEVCCQTSGVSKFSVQWKRIFRSLTTVIVAYAFANQSLLIAVGGFSLPADAGQNGPAFELCLHDSSGAPALPADRPDLSGCTHCIFCFAGAHHAMIGPAPAFFGRVDRATVVVQRLGNERSAALIIRHTIANPRGPLVVA
jgi:hypothetical protein